MSLGLSRTGAIMLVFFVQSATQGSWFPRVGDIQLQVGLTEAELGLALIGMPIGALLTFPFAGPLVERIGTRLTLMLSLPFFALSGALATLASNGWWLFFTTIFTGIGHGVTQLAMNVEADRVEALTGRRVMGRCHAMWSFGILAASIAGTVIRGFGISPTIHLFSALPLTVIAIVLAAGTMEAAPPRPHSGPLRKKFFATPTVPILLITGFSLSSVLLEGAAYTWSVIFLRDNFDIPVWMETLTLPAFLSAMMVSRLVSDGLVERHGPRRVAMAMSAISFLGLLAVVSSGALPVVLLGFALMGFGIAVSFPLAISASARLGDRPASDNLAAFTVLQRFLFLITPPVVGLIASGSSLVVAYACMLPFPLLSIWLARYLDPRPTAAEAEASA